MEPLPLPPRVGGRLKLIPGVTRDLLSGFSNQTQRYREMEGEMAGERGGRQMLALNFLRERNISSAYSPLGRALCHRHGLT